MEKGKRRETNLGRRTAGTVLRRLLPFLAIAVSANAQVLGQIDTIGGTIYDLQYTGSGSRTLAYDTTYGLNAAWTFSAVKNSGFPDQNMRYNFWVDSTHQWRYCASDSYMNRGVNVFQVPVSQGNLDVDPTSGRVYVAANQPATAYPLNVARSTAPGSATFQISGVPEGYTLPQVAIAQSGRTHTAMTTRNGYQLFYSGMSIWDTWSEPVEVAPPMPDPDAPNWAIAASHYSADVCITWLASDSGINRAFLAQSTDEGQNWQPAESLSLPPAYHPGSDTQVTAFGILPWYDPDEEPPAGEQPNLHVVGSFSPAINETTAKTISEIWHWSRVAGWSLISRAGNRNPWHPVGDVGYDAVYAGRPTLARDLVTRELICVWEQFDSTNAEPRTGLLRADIWAARGDSTGQFWGTPQQISRRDGTSKRFPCVASRMRGDTCAILYEVDSIAGFAVLGQGDETNNPMLVMWLPLGVLPRPRVDAAAETPDRTLATGRIEVWPNPSNGLLRIRAAQAIGSSHYQVRIHDASGKKVKQIGLGASACAVADLRDLPNGVYFISQEAGPAGMRSGAKPRTVKLILRK